MVEVRKCLAEEIFNDPASAELMAQYADECANAMLGKPRPRRDVYGALETTGCAQCFAAYEDGKLCGFALVLIACVPHYGLSHATVESLFVSREACRSGLGVALMADVEAHARQAGCGAIFYSAPAGGRLARLMFLQSDVYVNTNHIFTKRLA
jgi:GNAT superfamily N-acetyltransferase